MATIMNIFSRLGSSGTERQDAEFDTQIGEKSAANTSIQDVAAFELLGQHQQMISNGVDSVIKDLDSVAALVGQLSHIKGDMARTFESHRKMALELADVIKDKERAEAGLRDKSTQNESLTADLRSTRANLEETARNFGKAKSELEALENRFHLLGVSKKDVDDQLQRLQSQLTSIQDEATSLEREVAGLRENGSVQASRISELTEKYNDANNKCIFLTNKCEALELNLQEKISEMVGLRELVDLLTQEKETALVYGRQKEMEATQARTEANRLFQQNQQDKKTREIDANNLRLELDTVRSNLKTHQDLVAELRNMNERLTADLELAEERNKTLTANNNRREALITRISAKLEATATARSQIEQSRAVMSSRLETITQILAERESDVKRLESELELALSRHHEHAGMADDKIEALNNRVFELEKELSSSQNEAAFYSSQLDAIQRQPVRA